MTERKPHELLAYLVLHAVRYQMTHGLDGIHPAHFVLMHKYGARMDDFRQATNASVTDGEQLPPK